MIMVYSLLTAVPAGISGSACIVVCGLLELLFFSFSLKQHFWWLMPCVSFNACYCLFYGTASF